MILWVFWEKTPCCLGHSNESAIFRPDRKTADGPVFQPTYGLQQVIGLMNNVQAVQNAVLLRRGWGGPALACILPDESS